MGRRFGLSKLRLDGVWRAQTDSPTLPNNQNYLISQWWVFCRSPNEVQELSRKPTTKQLGARGILCNAPEGRGTGGGAKGLPRCVQVFGVARQSKRAGTKGGTQKHGRRAKIFGARLKGGGPGEGQRGSPECSRGSRCTPRAADSGGAVPKACARGRGAEGEGRRGSPQAALSGGSMPTERA